MVIDLLSTVTENKINEADLIRKIRSDQHLMSFKYEKRSFKYEKLPNLLSEPLPSGNWIFNTSNTTMPATKTFTDSAGVKWEITNHTGLGTVVDNSFFSMTSTTGHSSKWSYTLFHYDGNEMQVVNQLPTVTIIV